MSSAVALAGLVDLTRSNGPLVVQLGVRSLGDVGTTPASAPSAEVSKPGGASTTTNNFGLRYASGIADHASSIRARSACENCKGARTPQSPNQKSLRT